MYTNFTRHFLISYALLLEGLSRYGSASFSRKEMFRAFSGWHEDGLGVQVYQYVSQSGKLLRYAC